MTMGPGRQVWERFGHNAIWIHDPVHGTDQAYNYGLFDFHQQNFLLRFVRGQMWYWMAGFPAAVLRRVVPRSQPLGLGAGARTAAGRAARAAALPASGTRSRSIASTTTTTTGTTAPPGCATRWTGCSAARSAPQTGAVPAGTTYRFHTQRLTANDPLIYTGLLLALGQAVDRPISRWEEMFLPLEMREHVRTHSGDRTRWAPCSAGPVRADPVRVHRAGASATPPSWTLWYLLAGSAIGAAALALARRARTSGLARAGFLAVTWSWSGLTGLAGLVLAGLWGLTDHAAAYRNENLLQLDPLALPLIWLVTRLAFGSIRFARATLVLAMAVAAISLLGLLLKSLPPFYQVNQSIIALALPAHAGIAAAVLDV